MGHMLRAAVISQSPIVTHNGRHFWLLHEAWSFWSRAWRTPQEHRGILVLTHAPARPSADRLLELHASGLPTTNRFYFYTPQQGWQRRG
jgi:hypothetical protein